MKNPHVLIFTRQFDLHADTIILYLKSQHCQVTRLNSEDIPTNIRLTARLEDRWACNVDILPNGRTVNFSTVSAVWWRQPGRFRLPNTLTNQEKIFVTYETNEAISGLWSSLDCYWMSHPLHIREANWKIKQLLRAKNIGLEVPRTLVTSDNAAAKVFYEECQGSMIYKILSDPFLAAEFVDNATPRTVHTTFVTEEHLSLNHAMSNAPCLFQEYIPKKYELRITVIGDKVFAAEIHSQENPKTSTDWRHYDVSIPYKKASLPLDIEEKCIEFVHSFGLNYGAIDMIVTPDDRFVFLENNPTGQFLFVEQLVPELKMTQALGQCLLNGRNV